MITFLFWNLKKRPLQHLLATVARENKADVIILAECEIDIVDILEALNVNQKPKYSLTFSPSTRLIILTTFPHNSISPIMDVGGISIRKFAPPIGKDIILIAAHLSSKLFQDTDDQALSATRIARLIEQAEQKIGHTRTVVIGDLNMNPFEIGVVGAEALHAVMSRTVALRETRIVGGEEKRFFYNPMWGRFGEAKPGPPGTYFYNSSKQVTYFWNMFDQILLRPTLLSSFNEDDLEVITKAGTLSLLTNSGIPDDSLASDHLPILFRLNL
jgi:hypothetical protein